MLFQPPQRFPFVIWQWFDALSDVITYTIVGVPFVLYIMQCVCCVDLNLY
jgi:hypothetical protein